MASTEIAPDSAGPTQMSGASAARGGSTVTAAAVTFMRLTSDRKFLYAGTSNGKVLLISHHSTIAWRRPYIIE